MTDEPKSAFQYKGVVSYKEVGSKDEALVINNVLIIRRFYDDKTEYALQFIVGDDTGRTYVYDVLITSIVAPGEVRVLGKYVRSTKGKPNYPDYINNLLIDDRADALKVTGIWLEDGGKWEMTIDARKVADL